MTIEIVLFLGIGIVLVAQAAFTFVLLMAIRDYAELVIKSLSDDIRKEKP